jgi:hypothetical protein
MKRVCIDHQYFWEDDLGDLHAYSNKLFAEDIILEKKDTKK